MKVIFLDFDGVLNSEASVRMEQRKKTPRIMDRLSEVACSNLQYILEQDSSVKLVISSDWRKYHSLVELDNILHSYGVHNARILGFTPAKMSSSRASEIRMFLDEHPNITKFVVIDDNESVLGVEDPRGHIFLTDPSDGLLFKQARQIAKIFRAHDPKAVVNE